MFRRCLLTGLGVLAAGTGIAGIVLPLLPATPFLLISAALFVRSSPGLYIRLRESRFTGPYLAAWREGSGLSRRHKIRLLILLWTSLTASACLTWGRWWVLPLLAAAGTAVTWHIVSLKNKN